MKTKFLLDGWNPLCHTNHHSNLPSRWMQDQTPACMTIISTQKARGNKQLFKGEMANKLILHWRVLLHIRLLHEWSQRAHLHQEDKEEGEEEKGMKKEEKKKEKKDIHSTLKWNHWRASHINPMLYTSIKNTWHSINYVRGCHNYQGQWAEGVNCYFYPYLKRHPSNWASLENGISHVTMSRFAFWSQFSLAETLI